MKPGPVSRAAHFHSRNVTVQETSHEWSQTSGLSGEQEPDHEGV